MKATLALMKREYLEHRGAFLYAPLALLVLFGVAMFGALLSNRVEIGVSVGMPSALKAYEMGVMAMAGLWWVYLLAALFFYFADAFSADSRNNAMLFWKSMPVSDLRVLATKALSGLVLFPAIIVAFALAGAMLLYLGVMVGVTILPAMVPPAPVDILAVLGNIAVLALGYLALSLLWFAPFYAWVGMLSTLFRRWSMPLAFLIPGVAGIIENLFFYGRGGPDGGYILSYLRARSQFGFERGELQAAFFSDTPASAPDLLASLVASLDWTQMAIGLVVAVILVVAASEYRRRVLEK
jgi:ABC-2 type transport system permease protein